MGCLQSKMMDACTQVDVDLLNPQDLNDKKQPTVIQSYPLTPVRTREQPYPLTSVSTWASLEYLDIANFPKSDRIPRTIIFSNTRIAEKPTRHIEIGSFDDDFSEFQHDYKSHRRRHSTGSVLKLLSEHRDEHRSNWYDMKSLGWCDNSIHEPDMTEGNAMENKWIREAMIGMCKEIVNQVHPSPALVAHLIQEGVISSHTAEKMMKESQTTQGRCLDLMIKLIPSTHPKAFIVFRDALAEEYGWIVEKIKDISDEKIKRYQKSPNKSSWSFGEECFTYNDYFDSYSFDNE